MPENMSAAVVTRHGGPEVVEIQQVQRPEPADREVLVQVLASGVNFMDVYRRAGRTGDATPFTLGSECAGRVIAIGQDVSEVSVGDVVAGARSRSGTHAEFALLGGDALASVPESVSPDVAVALTIQGLTAHYLSTSTFALEKGHVALVHAAAGGVGQLLGQLAATRGAHVIGVVGSADKAQTARDAGSADVIVRDEVDDLAAAVRAIAPGGVDVVYDGVGQATFEASLASLRPRGLLALYGAASGPVPPFDLQRLNAAGSLYVTRPGLGHYAQDRAELRWRANELFEAVADGSLRVSIGGSYALAECRHAYEALESRQSTGKLVIIP